MEGMSGVSRSFASLTTDRIMSISRVYHCLESLWTYTLQHVGVVEDNR